MRPVTTRSAAVTMPRLLLTRPEEASRRFAEALGVPAPVISPLLQIVPLGPLPALAEGLIFTSQNGVAAYEALGGVSGKSVWCVGQRTAEASARLGLQVREVAPTAEELVRVSFPLINLTHLHGVHTRGDVAERLTAQGVPCQSQVIYDQSAVPLSPEARALLLSKADILLPLFSPRTAALFAQDCPAVAWPSLTVIAMSPAVAEPLSDYPIGKLIIADQPTGETMLTLAARCLG